MLRVVTLLVVGGVALAVTACGPDKPADSKPPANPNAGGGETANLSPAQKVFADTGCGKCHKLDTVGTGRMDLSKAGEKHDKAWIAAHIRNAKEHSPMSTMPPFPVDKLSDKDLETLAAYLAEKK